MASMRVPPSRGLVCRRYVTIYRYTSPVKVRLNGGHDLRPGRRPLRADALPPLWPQRPQAARRCRSGSGRTSARSARSSTRARSCAARSTSASRTSTWRTTTGRRTGPPSANFGEIMARDLRPYRDELVISTKAGYDMWPGPYGDWGSRKYLLASLDQSLGAHGPRLRRHLLLAPRRPGHAARGDDGRARHGGAAGQGAVRGDLVLLGPADAPRRRGSCATSARRCSSTSRRTRCSTAGSRRTCSTCSATRASARIVFSPLAQGMLTTKYLDGIPEDSRAAVEDGSLSPDLLTDETLAHVRALNAIAQDRGQSLAQMALAWTLRDPRVTSTLIGASSVAPARGERRRARAASCSPTTSSPTIDRARRRGRDQPLGAVERALTVRSRTAAGRRVRRLTET